MISRSGYAVLLLRLLQVVHGLQYEFKYAPGFVGAGNDVIHAISDITIDQALARCDSMPRCRAISYHGSNATTGPIRSQVYFKQTDSVGGRVVDYVGGDSSWSSFVKTLPVTAPAVTLKVGGTSELVLELRKDTFTVQSLNHTKANTPYSFTRPLDHDSSLPLCTHLGDISLRLQVGAQNGSWRRYDSTFLGVATELPHAAPVLASHDITGVVAASAEDKNESFPLKVVRSYETSSDGSALIMSFELTNVISDDVRLGGLGFSLPEAPGHPPKGIESTVWNDPHVGGPHGFVEFVRVVDDEKTLLVTAEKGFEQRTAFEAWRPILEDLGSGSAWEWTVHSEAWASEWRKSAQSPFLTMSPGTHGTPDMFPGAITPWPSTDGHQSAPVLPEASEPWNRPSMAVLAPGESRKYALRLQLAAGGPRTRNDLLESLGKPVIHGVPGYVLSSSMEAARLLVRPPSSATVVGVAAEKSGVGNGAISVGRPTKAGSSAYQAYPLKATGRGRVRVTVKYSDGTSSVVHYYVLPPFEEQVSALGQFYANVAWLPRDYPDPFGRGASVMPWDRETKTHVLNDARAYDVGLSDDAGGGNPLGFASKVRAAPQQDEVTRLDAYIKWTLYGVKPDTARPPLKSLQIGGDPDHACHQSKDPSECDGIRMTMFYYSADYSPNSSGHFAWNYTEAEKCHLPFGGPTWCMTEKMANATYRGFNFPHHTASYWAMYHVARNHDKLKTYKTWQWYLWRAAKTSIRATAGAGPGFMDGTVFREVLRALQAEVEENPKLILNGENASALHQTLDANNKRRQESWASQPYPYGSEFGFDTTGQEEVVIWNLHYGNFTAAKRTVDHILSYMRSSPTWAYNGGSRSWGDAGNNAKWLGAFGTGFDDRGQMHYRSGLNMIPLIEWFRANPDEWFLLEISMGAIAGQLTNIDATGAPSMMWWALPYMMTHDPHSGDYGLGFFGHSLESGSYYVIHKEFGELCYLCDILTSNETGAVAIKPRDSYHNRVFIEPLALYIVLEAGKLEMATLNLAARKMTLVFEHDEAAATFSHRRVRLEKTSQARPGNSFAVSGAQLQRGAYEIPAPTLSATIEWKGSFGPGLDSSSLWI